MPNVFAAACLRSSLCAPFFLLAFRQFSFCCRTWLIWTPGSLYEMMNDPDKAIYAYENTLRHHPYNVKALTQIATICRLKEQYPKVFYPLLAPDPHPPQAVEYFQRILNIENNNGEIWGALGHCYLMMDDLQKAYTAYQQALYHLPNPKV